MPWQQSIKSMPGHVTRALVRARSANSRRLAVLLALTGVLGLVRLLAFPVPDSAFVVFALWLLVGLTFDLGMPVLARRIRPQVIQAMMLTVDITMLAGFLTIVA